MIDFTSSTRSIASCSRRGVRKFCLTSSDAEVDAKLLDTHRIEVDIRGAVNGGTALVDPPRHYATVEQLDKEIVNARVWAGLHYRNSGQVGVELGRAVARYALDHYFQPRHHGKHDDNRQGDH